MARSAFVLYSMTVLLAACAQNPLTYEATTRLPTHERGQLERQLVVTIREVDSSFNTAPGSTPRSYGNTGRYQPSPYARRITDEIARDYDLKWVAGWRIDVLGVHCVVFAAQDRQTREQALERLQRDKRIESAQPMQQFRTVAGKSVAGVAHSKSIRTTTYNDPYYSLQRQMEQIRIPEAQRWSQGRGVRVAVIDTGADLTHPELIGRVRMARNFVDDDAALFNRDAHGTAVIGLIAAAVNNGLGIIGVAPATELLALKACWQAATQDAAVCNTLTLAEALAFAIERKAAVINLSLAGPDDPLLRRLVQFAIRRGTIVIAADPGSREAESSFPVAIPGVLAVADGDVSRTYPALKSHARIAAPGREVLTLAPRGRYDYLSGASLSSAMVTGVVALMLEHRPRIAPAEIAALLERTAFPLPADSSLASARAFRVVDACEALVSVMQRVSCPNAAAMRAMSRVSTAASKEPM